MKDGPVPENAGLTLNLLCSEVVSDPMNLRPLQSKFRVSPAFSPSATGSRGHSDPMDVDAVNSLSSGRRKSVIESARWVF